MLRIEVFTERVRGSVRYGVCFFGITAHTWQLDLNSSISDRDKKVLWYFKDDRYKFNMSAPVPGRGLIFKEMDIVVFEHLGVKKGNENV